MLVSISQYADIFHFGYCQCNFWFTVAVIYVRVGTSEQNTEECPETVCLQDDNTVGIYDST